MVLHGVYQKARPSTRKPNTPLDLSAACRIFNTRSYEHNGLRCCAPAAAAGTATDTYRTTGNITLHYKLRTYFGLFTYLIAQFTFIDKQL